MANTLNVRGVDDLTLARIKSAAAARNLALGQYLQRLVELHLEARAVARHGDATVAALLKAHGLEDVEGVEV